MYFCELCNYETEILTNRKSHTATDKHINNDIEPKYICGKCCSVFLTKKKMEMHIKNCSIEKLENVIHIEKNTKNKEENLKIEENKITEKLNREIFELKLKLKTSDELNGKLKKDINVMMNNERFLFDRYEKLFKRHKELIKENKELQSKLFKEVVKNL